LRVGTGGAEKRTKADRLERQTEPLEKKVDRHPDEIEKKPSTLAPKPDEPTVLIPNPYEYWPVEEVGVSREWMRKRLLFDDPLYLVNYFYASDRTALLRLIQSLYAAHKENQTFLHARFGLAEDVLEPYKKTIDRWLWPDVFLRQDVSVSQAKKAISDYRKAVGDPEGLAELMVFYCERAAGFCSDICNDDEGYYDALVSMFKQALKVASTLSDQRRDEFMTRLDRVRVISHKFGYGVEDDMDSLLSEYTLESL
jgi:hypothetical protein